MTTAKVVLTGSCGYVGTATKELLEASGYEVIEIDKKIGRDTKYLFSYLGTESPIAIIHLSALKSIPESKKKPWLYYFNNILSTLSVAIVARASSIPVVFAGSASVYSPNNAYARAKIVEEKILRLLCPSVALLRYFNIVGKSDTINDYGSTNLFEVIRRDKKLNINSITSKRDYVHILDIARANVMAMEHLLEGKKSFVSDVFTGESRTLLDVMEEYRLNGLTVEYEVLGLHDNDTIPQVDNRSLFGWTPIYTFGQAIKSEVDL